MTQMTNIDNLIKIMNGLVKNHGYSLKQLYDETTNNYGTINGSVIFSEFIKKARDKKDSLILDEFYKTSFL
jgi:hypothetical protein